MVNSDQQQSVGGATAGWRENAPVTIMIIAITAILRRLEDRNSSTLSSTADSPRSQTTTAFTEANVENVNGTREHSQHMPGS